MRIFAALLLLCVVVVSLAPHDAEPRNDSGNEAPREDAAAGGLGPHAWAPGEAEAFRLRQHQWQYARPLVSGNQFVSSTSSPFAVRVGKQALREGGHAVDAALACAFAQIVLSAGSWNSFAGVLMLMVYDAESGEVQMLEAGYRVPQAEDDPATIPASPTPSGRTALVPGFWLGAAKAHERHGQLDWAQLLEPAIKLAEDGFEITTYLGAQIAHKRDVLTRLPQTRRIFTTEEGRLVRPGDWFRQRELAETLRHVARDGAEYATQGEWARAFVEAVRSEGGRVTMEDMRQAEAQWVEPLRATYRDDVELVAPDRGSIGAVQLIEALRLLVLADLEAPGDDATLDERAERLYWQMQIARIGVLLSTLDEATLRGILPEIPADTDIATWRSSERAARILWRRMQQPAWLHGLQQRPIPQRDRSGGGEGHSDAIITRDANGNIALLTHTINTRSWGDTGLFVGGVSIPDSASFQQQRVALAGPGGRLTSEIVPVIGLRDGEPVLLSNVIGASLHETTLQAIIALLDEGKDPKQAAEQFRFMGPTWQPDPTTGEPRWPGTSVIRGEFDTDLLDAIRKRGQPIHELPFAEGQIYRSHWIGATRQDEEPQWHIGVTFDLNAYTLAAE